MSSRQPKKIRGAKPKNNALRRGIELRVGKYVREKHSIAEMRSRLDEFTIQDIALALEVDVLLCTKVDHCAFEPYFDRSRVLLSLYDSERDQKLNLLKTVEAVLVDHNIRII